MYRTRRGGVSIISGLLGLAAAACGEAPGPPRPGQAAAFEVVARHFAGAFPGRTLAQPEVAWWTTDCPGTSLSAVILDHTCYSGLFYRTDGVDVAWRGSFGLSAYAHELMHYFLLQAEGTSDPEHLRVPMWELVNQTDTDLQDQQM